MRAIAKLFMIVDGLMGFDLFGNISHLISISMLRIIDGIGIALELVGDDSTHNSHPISQ